MLNRLVSRKKVVANDFVKFDGLNYVLVILREFIVQCVIGFGRFVRI